MINGFDYYAIYNSKEYTAEKVDKDFILLYSEDLNDLNFGFSTVKISGSSLIKKTVNKNNISSAYSKTLYGIYQGHKFFIRGIKDDKDVALSEDNSEIAEKFKFEVIDRGDYIKWVNESELERIWDEKKGIWGFPTPQNPINIIKE